MDTEERFETVAETVTRRVGNGVSGHDRDLVFFDAWWLNLQAGTGGLIQWAGNSGPDRILRTVRSLEKIGFEKALPIVRGFLEL
ncbi:MAG: DMP19 family protein, partial [Sediminispirochaetaceae bacterium]